MADLVSRCTLNIMNSSQPPGRLRSAAIASILSLTVSSMLSWDTLEPVSVQTPSDYVLTVDNNASGVDAISYSANRSNMPSLLQDVMTDATDRGDEPVETTIERVHSASRSVAEYVSTSFKIPFETAQSLTQMAVEIGEAKNVDPLLILAIVATESSYNPKARSGSGAEGLMQVMTSVHRSKFAQFGGQSKAFDPYANMSVGTDILSELLQRTGNVRKALKWYSGAANMSSDNGYSARVLAERHRLAIAAMGDTESAVALNLRRDTAPTFSMEKEAENVVYEGWVPIGTNG